MGCTAPRLIKVGHPLGKRTHARLKDIYSFVLPQVDGYNRHLICFT